MIPLAIERNNLHITVYLSNKVVEQIGGPQADAQRLICVHHHGVLFHCVWWVDAGVQQGT